MKKIIIIIGLVILLITSGYSLTLDTDINTSVSNSSITFDTINLTVDYVQIEDNFIYLSNVSYIYGSLTVTELTYYNHSISNYNINSSYFPNLNTLTTSLVKVTSQLNNTVDATLEFALSKQPLTVSYSSNDATYTKNYGASEFTYSGGTLTIDVTGIEQGTDNTFTFTYPYPTGSSGSSGYTPPTETIDLDKIDCDLDFSPYEIIIAKNNLDEIVTINNNEDFTIDPDFYIEYVSGNRDLVDELDLGLSINVFNSLTSNTLSISSYGSIKDNAKANLIFSSYKCNEIIIPITISLTDKTPLEQIQYDLTNKTIKQNIIDLNKANILTEFIENEGNKDSKWLQFIKVIDSILGYTLIFSAILGVILFPTSNSSMMGDSWLSDAILRLIIWFIITGIIGLLIWVIKIVFVG